MEKGPRARLNLGHTWDGETLEAAHGEVEAWLDNDELVIEVEACFHGDSPPPGPPGLCEGLWEFEVAELFLAGEDGRYLELELGPWGHYLAILFRAPREAERRGLPMRYSAWRREGRWGGRASIDRGWLPGNVDRGNAYAIYGQGVERRYLAAFPVAGSVPDFHQPERFGSLRLE